MAYDETTWIKVKLVTLGCTLVGTMTKPRNIRTLDALNLKPDFLALTDATKEGDPQSRPTFMAVNRRLVIYVEEVS